MRGEAARARLADGAGTSPGEADVLSGVEALARLPESSRRSLADVLQPIDLAPGERLFSEGEPSQGLVVVDRGRLRLRSARGCEGEVGAGALLGAFSLVSGRPRATTAEAVCATRVRVLHSDAFGRLIDDAPRAACHLLAALLHEGASLAREAADVLAPPRR